MHKESNHTVIIFIKKSAYIILEYIAISWTPLSVSNLDVLIHQ